jgi:hypothetical protein
MSLPAKPKTPSAAKPVSFETYLEGILTMAMSGQLMNAGYTILTLPKKQAIMATLYVSNRLDGKAYEQFAFVLASLCEG